MNVVQGFGHARADCDNLKGRYLLYFMTGNLVWPGTTKPLYLALDAHARNDVMSCD